MEFAVTPTSLAVFGPSCVAPTLSVPFDGPEPGSVEVSPDEPVLPSTVDVSPVDASPLSVVRSPESFDDPSLVVTPCVVACANSDSGRRVPQAASTRLPRSSASALRMKRRFMDSPE
jgi:hypothetical protein